MILFYLVVNSIHEDKRVHAFQRPVLPGNDLWHDLLADLTHKFRGDLYIVQTLDLLCDILLAHTAGIQ